MSVADLKLVKLPTEADKRAAPVNHLVDIANGILDGTIEADCFVFLAIDTAYNPPSITPIDYDMSYGDYILALRETERFVLSEAYDDLCE